MSVKIIQILIGPDNSTYQGNILGLGSDGAVYYASHDGLWHQWFSNKIADLPALNKLDGREVR